MLNRSLQSLTRSLARARAAPTRLPLPTPRLCAPGARLASTSAPGGQKPQTAIPYVALAGVVAVGAYYVLAPTSSRPLSALAEEEVEEKQVRHYLLRKKKHDEIEKKHQDELNKELGRLVAEQGPDVLEKRKACEAKRAKIKEHEQLLMKHRHDESFPNMRGKTQSWAERERAAAVELTHEEGRMLELKEKLEKERGCKFDDCM